MRQPIIERFPKPQASPATQVRTSKVSQEAYVTDAYHSLSIDGCRVTPELIERVRRGPWNPDANEQDREPANAMAARGYRQAFQVVEKSIGRVPKGEKSWHHCRGR